MQEFLQPSSIVNRLHPAVRSQAAELTVADDPIATAKACFEFVRDEIRHSRDFETDPATCLASDVLAHRTGYCYAKSHLLAALLRANHIPAGLCYQRLSVNDAGPPYCLHGFNAVYLPEHGWYRVDARGNKPGVAADFAPPIETLAFPLQSAEEIEFKNILAEPLACVVSVLQSAAGWRDVLARLPDATPDQFPSMGLKIRRRGGSSSSGE